MIDFACKQFNLSEVIKCSLGLTRVEFAVLERVIGERKRAYRSEYIASELQIDSSTAQRAMKKLHGHGVLERHQLNLAGGGYVFEYVAVPRAEMRRIVMRVVGKWVERVDEALANWSPERDEENIKTRLQYSY